MPGVQAGRVFSGYPAGGFDSRIAGQSGTGYFWVSFLFPRHRMKEPGHNRFPFHFQSIAQNDFVTLGFYSFLRRSDGPI